MSRKRTRGLAAKGSVASMSRDWDEVWGAGEVCGGSCLYIQELLAR